jgi:hypothetical protein
MRHLALIFSGLFLVLAAQQTTSSIDVAPFVQNDALAKVRDAALRDKSIRTVDFRNFTYPWTTQLGNGRKFFSLKNGAARSAPEQYVTFQGVLYVPSIDDNDGDEALVNINILDGTATYTMLYVYTLESNKPKLLESFEFGDGYNTHFAAAFAAHGELVVESYIQEITDPECCPSMIEVSYYKWQKDKFVIQGEPQRIPNGFVQRAKAGQTDGK